MSTESWSLDEFNKRRGAVNGVPNLDGAGLVPVAQIPNLDAAKITTGAFADARIPNLDAAKTTTGAFADARIPNLDAAKITSGTVDANRIANGSITTAKVADFGLNGTVSYISDTGTDGVVNTNQNVKTIAVPANTLTAGKKKIRGTLIFERTGGGTAITATFSLNGVSIFSVSDPWTTGIAWFEITFLNSTHANIAYHLNTDAGVTLVRQKNVAGLDFTASQNLTLAQAAVAAQALRVLELSFQVIPQF